MSRNGKPTTEWLTIDELRKQQEGCEFGKWLNETLPKITPEQRAKFNRYGDPIAEYGDWTDDNEWIPPDELIPTAKDKGLEK
ncbi:MAG TPA: hypothetical protein VJY57_10160 [Thiopseudomonas sp.]|nr:hypothetical protein [Thiopseudomonas sp.]